MAIASLVTYVLMGLLFVGLAIPLRLNVVPPNHWYGFRTRLTLSDPKIWYPVNAFGGRWLIWIGVATLVAGPVCLLLPESWLAAYMLATSALWVLALIVVLVLGVRYARRLAEHDPGS